MRIRNFNALNDVLFKYVFGREERKNITIAFINAVLGCEEDNAVVDLRFAERTVDPNGPEDKTTVLDIFCIGRDGTQFNIEVQVQNMHNMERRTLYYWAQLYRDSIKKGADYDALRRTVTINLLAYSFLPQPGFHNMYGLYDIRTQHRLTEDIEIHFLELPKVTRKDLREMRRLEKWMAYFENDLSDEEMEELAMSEPAINDAWSATDEFLRDASNFHAYLQKEMAERDYHHEKKHWFEDGRREGMEKGLAKGRAEGMSKGIAKGKAEGRAEGRAEGKAEGMAQGMAAERNRFIRLFIENGMSIASIAETADLSIEEVQKIAEEQGFPRA